MRYLLLFLIAGLLLAGCSAEKKAIKKFQAGKYQTAIEMFQKQLSDPSKSARANYFIAESYRLSNRIKEAEPFYEKAGGRGIDKDSIKFYYAESLKSNGKYDAAKAQLEALLTTAAEDKMK